MAHFGLYFTCDIDKTKTLYTNKPLFGLLFFLVRWSINQSVGYTCCGAACAVTRAQSLKGVLSTNRAVLWNVLEVQGNSQSFAAQWQKEK